jgi:hypothetical protein
MAEASEALVGEAGRIVGRADLAMQREPPQ